MNPLCRGNFPVRLPEVKYDVETGNYTVIETETKPLVLSESCPVATTCSLFDELVFTFSRDSCVTSRCYACVRCDE